MRPTKYIESEISNSISHKTKNKREEEKHPNFEIIISKTPEKL